MESPLSPSTLTSSHPPAFPPCRHRGEPVSPGAHACGSPKLVGLKLVSAAVCGGCCYRDHEPAAVPAPPRLAPCAWWVPGPAAEGCQHPGHPHARAADCDACPDFLFPVLTPQTPPAWAARLVGRPPRPQPDGWWRWPNVQEAYRRAADEQVRLAPAYPGGHAGRGVVIAGGGPYFASAYVTVRVLRHVGCRLPIELWHLAGEVTAPMAELLAPYGVECIDADRVALERPFRFIEGHWWKGWQLKPYAVAHSRFREVLFLDADCYPVRDPSFLFDWPAYREHGAAFWPDCATSAGLLPAALWEVFGAPPRHPPFESGQLLLDKRACWAELRLALWYNAQADYVYRLLWGDKDTFNVAWSRLGRTYALAWPECGWDTHTILQPGPDGRVLFQHRCQDKFRLGGESFSSTGQAFRANRYNPRLAHEDACFGFLDELRRHGSLDERRAP